MNKKKYLLVAISVMLVAFTVIASACGIIDNLFGDEALSAYEIAVENGFSGTEAEWLASLKGEKGDNGENAVNESLYKEAVENGYEGTFFEFLEEYFGSSESKGSVEYATSVGLLSAVSVYCDFTVTTKVYTPWGSRDQTETQTSAGAGVIYALDKEEGDAYIITNYHVVYDVDSDTGISEDIHVYLYGSELSGKEIAATYVGGSMTYDIAVLKIDNSGVLASSAARACDVEDSNDIVAGMDVIAIGNPEAEGISATAGIVSVDSEYITMTAADDATTVRYRVIRVDSAVNGGNSGGGLYNSEGKLIGIVNAKVIDDEVENIAYAIPSNIASYCAQNIIANCDDTNKSPIKCVLGVTLQIVDSYAVFDSNTLTTMVVNTVSISEIATNADALGYLKTGDVIKSFTVNGVTIEVKRLHTVVDYMLLLKAGDVVTFNVTRGGTEVQVDVTLKTTQTVS
ncbi:MAG: trypsin-like peptidase domain-containing protein [Clostridia bacterium]|nr:trypsin-like peptidase domain-containing protein [Clostridia bacterium]